MVSYEYPIDIHEDYIPDNYSSFGYWWGRPFDLENVSVVYIKDSLVRSLQDKIVTYDRNFALEIKKESFVDAREYTMKYIESVLRKYMRIGNHTIIKVVENE